MTFLVLWWMPLLIVWGDVYGAPVDRKSSDSKAQSLPKRRNSRQSELMSNLKKFQLMHSSYLPDDGEFKRALETAQLQVEKLNEQKGKFRKDDIIRTADYTPKELPLNGIDMANISDSLSILMRQEKTLQELEAVLNDLKVQTALEKTQLTSLQDLQKKSQIINVDWGTIKEPKTISTVAPNRENVTRMPYILMTQPQPKFFTSSSKNESPLESIANVSGLSNLVEKNSETFLQGSNKSGESEPLAVIPAASSSPKQATSTGANPAVSYVPEVTSINHKLYLVLPNPPRSKRKTSAKELVALEHDMALLKNKIAQSVTKRVDLKSFNPTNDLLFKVKVAIENKDS